jgi:hypothetical protein
MPWALVTMFELSVFQHWSRSAERVGWGDLMGNPTVVRVDSQALGYAIVDDVGSELMSFRLKLRVTSEWILGAEGNSITAVFQ